MKRLWIVTAAVQMCLLSSFAAPVAGAQAQLSAQAQQDRHEPKLIEFSAPRAATVSSPPCASPDAITVEFATQAAGTPICGTLPWAINAEGVIAGAYTDASVVFHGFLRTPNGHIVSFDAPVAGKGSAQGTFSESINDWGVIVGTVEDSNAVYHGFVRYGDGSFKTLDVPGEGIGPGQGTQAFDINLEGETAGISFDVVGSPHGYVRSPDGEFTSFDPIGSIYTFVCTETCLNLEGVITGLYLDGSFGVHGFVREPNGKITSFDVPVPVGAPQVLTVPNSINDLGEITGLFGTPTM